MTIERYLNNVGENPFWGGNAGPPAVANAVFQTELSEYISAYYSDYKLRKAFKRSFDEGGYGSLANRVRGVCDIVYIAHSYSYQTLWNTTNLEYNPIENYRMIETENTKNSGNDTITKREDGYTDTENRSSYTDDEMLGDTSLTDKWGEMVQSGNNTNQRAPFESQNYQNYDKDVTNSIRNAYEDVHTTVSVDNVYAHGERSITRDVGARGGVDKTDFGHVIDRELERSGNIGVTTSQQMIASERDVARFNFLRIVANDIIKTLCVAYEGVIV